MRTVCNLLLVEYYGLRGVREFANSRTLLGFVPLLSGISGEITGYRNTLKAMLCLVKMRKNEHHELMEGKRCFREFGRN
jgi:hypothetical protein